MMEVGGPGLLQGTGASLARTWEGYHSTCVGTLMLKMPVVDGDLQPVPLVCQAEVLHLEAGVYISKLSSKSSQRAHRLMEKLMADGATPAHEL